MSDYFAFRRVKLEELPHVVTSIRYQGRWYNVLGYDAREDQFIVEDYTDAGFIVDAQDVNHNDMRVEVGIKTLNEVLDLFDVK